MTAPSLSVLIPTFNEEVNIEHALASVSGWAGEVFVLDSLSTDSTIQRCKKFPNVQVFEHAFEGYSKQWNWALDNLPFSKDWVLLLASDEYLPEECKREIEQALASADSKSIAGYYMNRKLVMFGTWLRFGGAWPSWHLRIWRRGKGRFEDRSVNESLILDGPSAYLKEPFVHDDHKGLTDWIQRHNKYSTLEAKEFFNRNGSQNVSASLFGSMPERKRFLRYHVWNHLPMRPSLLFMYSYVFRMGLLEGRAGFRYARMLQMYQYWMDLKIEEISRSKTPPVRSK